VVDAANDILLGNTRIVDLDLVYPLFTDKVFDIFLVLRPIEENEMNPSCLQITQMAGRATMLRPSHSG
jgi:hypothetical protein